MRTIAHTLAVAAVAAVLVGGFEVWVALHYTVRSPLFQSYGSSAIKYLAQVFAVYGAAAFLVVGVSEVTVSLLARLFGGFKR